MPIPHHSAFTSQMLFLLPNQKHQSTENCLNSNFPINMHKNDANNNDTMVAFSALTLLVGG